VEQGETEQSVAPHSISQSAGQWTTGGVVSSTVMIWSQLLVSPLGLVHVQVRVIVDS